MTEQFGLVMGMMEPPAEMEGEFQDWYDMEHIPSRSAVPGFLTGHRMICLEGWPRYIAMYDIKSTNVLKSAKYLAIKNDNISPWSNRISPKAHGYFRVISVQTYPGNAVFGQRGVSSRVLVLRFKAPSKSAVPDILRGLRSLFEGRPETVQVRLFRPETGGVYHIGMIELLRPVNVADMDVSQFRSAAKYLDLVNVYTQYFRRVRHEWP